VDSRIGPRFYLPIFCWGWEVLTTESVQLRNGGNAMGIGVIEVAERTGGGGCSNPAVVDALADSRAPWAQDPDLTAFLHQMLEVLEMLAEKRPEVCEIAREAVVRIGR
jgi:hypothetical protein